MRGDAARFFKVTTLAVLCALGAHPSGPCHALTGEPAATVLLAAGPERHVIKAGETVNLLALRYGVPAAAILKANPGLNPSRLQLGKEIVIPASGRAPHEAAPAPSAAPSARGIELRPESAPQATPHPQPSGLRAQDPPDASSRASSPASVERAPDAAAPPETAARATPETAARAVQATPAGPAAGEGAAAAVPASSRAAWGMAVALLAVAVVGLALQGLLANLAAGCVLRLSRIFRVGDEISMAGIVGRVRRLGLLYVVIRSGSGEKILVPNAKATSEIMVLAAPRPNAE